MIVEEEGPRSPSLELPNDHRIGVRVLQHRHPAALAAEEIAHDLDGFRDPPSLRGDGRDPHQPAEILDRLRNPRVDPRP